MPTFTALTTLRGGDRAQALGAAMESLSPEPTGVGVTEVEDGAGLWEVGGYFTEKPDETGLALLAAAFGARTFAISELPETDWVQHVRRELAPVHAGRFFLYGSHDADKVPANVVALRIDAATAFGTGHHGTTRGCLMALDRLASGGFVPNHVADIGCGTAVLAMAAAKLWPDAATIAGDVDGVAVETARANLGFNDLKGAVCCVKGAGFEHPEIAELAPYDLIMANILKGPLLALAPDMYRAAGPGGVVILSGILKEQASEVTLKYADHHLDVEDRVELGEWVTLTLKSRKI
ncbi:MAG: 50S ribosomal protein L11 methyltransferase [Paracoccaceae bacterium]